MSNYGPVRVTALLTDFGIPKWFKPLIFGQASICTSILFSWFGKSNEYNIILIMECDDQISMKDLRALIFACINISEYSMRKATPISYQSIHWCEYYMTWYILNIVIPFVNYFILHILISRMIRIRSNYKFWIILWCQIVQSLYPFNSIVLRVWL